MRTDAFCVTRVCAHAVGRSFQLNLIHENRVEAQRFTYRTDINKQEPVHGLTKREMQQQEFDLFCQVLAEDSLWLDSYQTSLLQSTGETSKKIVNADETEAANDDVEDRPYTTAHERHEICVEDASIVQDLPAAEFVCQKTSCVAAQSFTLLNRAVSSCLGSRATISFKKARRPNQNLG